MPTFNRAPFVRLALQWFEAQDYPRKELLVIDDGTDPVAGLVRGRAGVTYISLRDRMTIGSKRNLACERAAGDVLLQWDDDDWFGPARISTQVADLEHASGDVNAVALGVVYDMVGDRFWSAFGAAGFTPQPAIAYSTLGFTRQLWRDCGGYPDLSIGEDMGFVQRAVGSGARVRIVDDPQLFVHVRHGANSWRFVPGAGRHDPWIPTNPPGFLADVALESYRSLQADLIQGLHSTAAS